MPNEDLRRKLLAAYALALVEERASWERLSDPQLSEVERFHTYSQWKPAAARLKTLVHELRDASGVAAPAPDDGLASGPASGASISLRW